MPPLVVVVGPTATGKSALAVTLAQRLGGEVVNADSMQLYRGMDIGTAKLSPDERAGVPHHLLDVWDVTETASVADYQRRARECIDSLLSRRVTPVLVGGSGLYVRAVVDPITFPGTDRDLRAALEQELEEIGSPAMHARLAAVDAAAAAVISPANSRKVVRALEVVELTGRPFLTELPRYDAAATYEAIHVGLDLDTAALDERVEQRVARMFAAGLEDEVRALDAIGLRSGFTASRALGYAQLLAVIDGRIDRERARGETVRATRRFVRRQRSWFRRDPRIRWLDAGHDVNAEALEFVTNRSG
jgi:tRNA dimethylallyltransferase